MDSEKPSPETQEKAKKAKSTDAAKKPENAEREVRGYADSGLLEPTRFGDWEVKGRCSDF